MKLFYLFLLFTVSVASAAPGTRANRRAIVTPLQSDSFVESVGVNTHLWFAGPYRDTNAFDELVLPSLLDLGIRHVRDGVVTPLNTTGFYAKVNTLFSHGIHTGLVANAQWIVPGTYVDPSKFPQVISLAGGPDRIEYIEASNEPNNNSQWSSTGYLAERTWVSTLYNQIKSDPVTYAGIKVMAPGMAHLGPSPNLLGPVTVDIGNWHTYPGGIYAPESMSRVLQYTNAAKSLFGANTPLYATEDGYHTALASTKWPCPESVRARWIPRMLIWNLQGGISRTYLYELISSHAPSSSDMEANFGLIQYRAAGVHTPPVPNPDYYAVKNMISLFADPGPSFAPTPLNFSVTNNTGPIRTLLKTALFQKRNGTYLLPIWFATPSTAVSPVFSPTNDNLPPVSYNVQVNLPTTVSSVIVHAFGDDGNVTDTSYSTPGGVLPLAVTDSMQVIEISSSNVTPVAANINPAPFFKNQQSGIITLSYTDADGDLASTCSVSNLNQVTVTQPCSCDAAGVCTLKVTGISNYTGSASFDYTVTAHGLSSAPAHAFLTVLDSSPPVAANISASFDEDISSLVTLSYTDPDGDLASACSVSGLSQVSVTQPCGCTAGVCSVGVKGAPDYNGPATFTYSVTANGAVSNTATATLTVQPVDDLPVTGNIAASFDEDTSSVITLSYSDPDGDLAGSCALSNLSNVAVTQACSCSAGACTVGVGGAPNYNGPAGFSYTVTANGAVSNSAAATLTIQPVDDAPVATNISPSDFDADAESGLITLSYSDADGDYASTCSISDLNHVSVTQPCSCDGSGVCSLKVKGVTHYRGPASFKYSLSANGAASNLATAAFNLKLVKTLSHDFTSGTLDSSLSYSRAGGATRTNAAGLVETLGFNQPRFSYDSLTGASNGLLIEEARVNLFSGTEELNGGAWVKTRGSMTANSAAAPDGRWTAEKWVEDTANGGHYFRNQTLNKSASSQVYTWSAYVKAGERSQVEVHMANSTLSEAAFMLFTLSGNGTVTPTFHSANWGVPTGTITALANGWYRITMTSTTDAATTLIVLPYLYANGSNSYLGNGTSGMYFWGLQLEQAAMATSYIPARNLFQYSEQLENSAWAKTGLLAFGSGSVANATGAPDGTGTADLVVESPANSVHGISRGVGTANSAAQPFAMSFFAKAGGRKSLRAVITGAAGNSIAANFSLDSGTVTAVTNGGNGTNADASITSVGGGWYRCVLTGQPDTAGTALSGSVSLLNDSDTPVYAGDGASGAYVWGLQLETGASATAYVATTGTAVRGADLLQSSLGPWFDAAAGTLVSLTRAGIPPTGKRGYVTAFTDGTTGNLLAQYFSAAGASLGSITGGTEASATVAAANGTTKLASAYQANDLQIYANGAAGAPSSSGALPTVTTLFLGSDGSDNFLNGYLKALDYYPSRVSDAELSAFSQ